MRDKRYHIVIGSVLFAILTWLSVNMRYDYTVVRNMPVVLENMKEGKALKYAIPKSVAVRFSGSGWLIAGLYLVPEVKYYIDVSSLGSEPLIITGRDVLEHVKLPFAVQPIDVKPDTLLLELDDYVEKRVPVVPRIKLDFHEGYGQVGAITVVPESVDVGGSREMIAHLTGWQTAYQKFSDRRTPIDEDVDLEPPANYSLAVDRNNVHLTISVQPLAEKVFSGIPITATMTPANREVIFIPPKMDIIVRGGIDRLAKLTNGDFEATIPFETLLQDSSEAVVPALTAPAEITIISRKPERLQFIIRKKL